MAGVEFERKLDEEIKAREKLLSEYPTKIQKALSTPQFYPKNVIRRIHQLDGVLIEFNPQK